jgi:hypothetical protein
VLGARGSLWRGFFLLTAVCARVICMGTEETPMAIVTHEGQMDITSVDDAGQALVAEIVSDISGPEFFRFQSWDPSKRHTGINQFIGRTVRITIETLD